MHKLHLTATVPEDRKLVVTLPLDVPTGRVEIDLTIRESPAATSNGPIRQDGSDEEPYFSLAEWFEKHAEHWGDQIRSDDVEGFTGRRY